MLDENLPTFRFKPSDSHPGSSILYFTQNGAEPAPEYMLRHPDPTQPLSRNKYAVALCDPYSPDIIYGEVVVQPEWTQPTLLAAEIRAQQQQQQNGGAPPTVPTTAVVPDGFTVLLYNPDQSIPFKLVPGSWNKNDSWEFEVPTVSFRLPSSSELDRVHDSNPSDLAPKVMFRWKKDSKLGKDMTCYMTGKNLGGGRKSKEPDITVAFSKAARECAVTVYEPNLNRVEVEDRKGLEVALLLSAQVVRDLWLAPRADVFNVSSHSYSHSSGVVTPPAATTMAAASVMNVVGRRKNSRPAVLGPSPPANTTIAMSGALGSIPPSHPPPPLGAGGNAIDAETRRLQAMVEQEAREEREREARERAERERRDRAEERRIKKMLEDEEREARRREAEVAKETERLRRVYGTEGQDLPSSSSPSYSPPLLPPPGRGSNAGGFLDPNPPHNPALPPRPVSAGPGPRRERHGSGSGSGGGGGGYSHPQAGGNGGSSAYFSGIGGRPGKERVQKKRSMHW